MERLSRPFGLRDKIGYAFGDLGNDFTFMLSAGFLLKFYTDIMSISPGAAGIIMMAARLISAFSDVVMGQIIDRFRPRPDGKFRPWLKWMCWAPALTAFLLYQSSLAPMPYAFKLCYMAVTFVLWSTFYTVTNIPYGSMASAISQNPSDRTSLSVWRSVGGSLAGLIVNAGTPLFAYVTAKNGASILSGPRMTILAGVFSLASMVSFLLCYSLVRERVQTVPNTVEPNVKVMLRGAGTNRPLVGIITASILLLLALLGVNGMAGYVFPVYYGAPAIQSMASLIGTVGMLAVCAPIASKLADRFGKKEVSIGASLFGAASYLACLIVHPKSPYLYTAFFSAAYIGIGFFNTLIWAMITDVIDDAQARTGIREDGTIYAFYSFARKFGQSLSSGMIGIMLALIGYTDDVALNPTAYPETLEGIFRLSCWIPIIGLISVAVVLHFLYPLGKAQVQANAQKLRQSS